MILDSPVLVRTLSSGTTVLIEPMPDVQSAALAILVPAGTNAEPAGANGAAAVLTELVMRGAGERDSRELSDAFDFLGVQHSESNNSSTMAFSAALLADHLPRTLELYADILRRAQLPDEEFEPSLEGVSQSLQALEDEPQRRVMIELRRSAYDDPWGRPSDGTLDDLPRIDLNMLRTMYSAAFRGNQTIIGIAGNVDPDRVTAHLESLLSGWTNGPSLPLTLRPPQDRVRHLPHASTQTHIGLAWDAVPYGHEDYYHAWAASNVLGGNSSSRLFTQVRERRGLCYSVSTSLSSAGDAGRMLTYAGTTTDRAQETLDVTLAEIARLAEGITAAELQLCQAHAKSSLVMSQESSASRASSIARDWQLLGRVQSLAEIHQRVESLTVAGVNDYLTRHPVHNPVVVTLGERPLNVGTPSESPHVS
jgi:predicted Zn-dependent peptidase